MAKMGEEGAGGGKTSGRGQRSARVRGAKCSVGFHEHLCLCKVEAARKCPQSSWSGDEQDATRSWPILAWRLGKVDVRKVQIYERKGTSTLLKTSAASLLSTQEQKKTFTEGKLSSTCLWVSILSSQVFSVGASTSSQEQQAQIRASLTFDLVKTGWTDGTFWYFFLSQRLLTRHQIKPTQRFWARGGFTWTHLTLWPEAYLCSSCSWNNTTEFRHFPCVQHMHPPTSLTPLLSWSLSSQSLQSAFPDRLPNVTQRLIPSNSWVTVLWQ